MEEIAHILMCEATEQKSEAWKIELYIYKTYINIKIRSITSIFFFFFAFRLNSFF